MEQTFTQKDINHLTDFFSSVKKYTEEEKSWCTFLKEGKDFLRMKFSGGQKIELRSDLRPLVRVELLKSKAGVILHSETPLPLFGQIMGSPAISNRMVKQFISFRNLS